jgi:hypothetical protein
MTTFSNLKTADFQYTHVYLFFVLHHWASFTGVCHGFGLKTGIDET